MTEGVSVADALARLSAGIPAADGLKLLHLPALAVAALMDAVPGRSPLEIAGDYGFDDVIVHRTGDAW